MKAMILDDDPLILTLLSNILLRKGYEVVTYSNPKECSHYSSTACQCPIEEVCPNVIISDFDMPHVNGMEFIEALRRKKCRCLHIALISGLSLPETLIRRAAILGVKFFAKPFHAIQITDWLKGIEPALPLETGSLS